MSKLQVIDFDINELRPYDKNPRNNERAIEYVKNSIEKFGMNVPLVIDINKVIVTGHTRYEACKLLGYKTVPCLIADDLTEMQIKAFRLVDNKVAEMATWDFDMLEDELANIDMDMDIFGFDFNSAEGNTIQAMNEEISLEQFSDETFEYECPVCGFRFN